jgi:hypothetical protein
LEEKMIPEIKNKPENVKQITAEDVNRVLEVGRIFFSILTVEEIEELTTLCSKIGNAGDS